MNINIVCIGKLKESYWREAVSEYVKRVSPYVVLRICELPESRLPENPSPAQIESALTEEYKSMLPYVSARSAYNVALCVEGEQLDSLQLAKGLDRWGTQGFSTVNFFIGSSFGLSGGLKASARLRLSMSRLTLPHQLARVVLCEQIYRAYTIINNKRYHK